MSAARVRQLSDVPRRGWFAVTHHQFVVGVILLVALLFYLWTAATSYPIEFTRVDGVSSQDAYNLLTTAFLHGHLYLPFHVPAGLVRLSQPYNPTRNFAYQGLYHDLLLYHDRFYSAWGPSPALLFAIVRLTGYRLPNSLAVALYCFGGLVAAVGVLHALARRFVAGMPDWMLLVATIGLAFTNVAPFLLRRPAQYEVAISGAYCFEMAGLYLVTTAALTSSVRRWRLALGSFMFGMAVLSRPTMLAGGLVLIGVTIVLLRRGAPRRRLLIVAFAPFLVWLVVLAAYNDARFGTPGNFGTRYQLSGVDQYTHPGSELDYVAPGMFTYLFIPAQLSLDFPHVFLQSSLQLPFSVPASYEGSGVRAVNGNPEFTGGMLPTMPITIILLGLPVVWWRRRPGERPALLVIMGGVVVCLAVMFLLTYAIWGTTQRYEVDYATWGLLAAFLLWGLMVGRMQRGSWRRRSLAGAGVVLTALGAGAGVAVSFTGYLNLLQLEHPSTYDDVQSLTTPLVTLLTEVTGRPALLSISSPAPVTPPPGSPYTKFTAAGSTMYAGGYPSVIMINSPRNESAALSALAVRASAPLAGQVIQVTSQGAVPTTVPILGLSLRIPISLHRGLNQIILQSEHATIYQQEQAELVDLHITR